MNQNGGWGQEAPLTLEGGNAASVCAGSAPNALLADSSERSLLDPHKPVFGRCWPNRVWARLVPGASFPCPRTYLAFYHPVP